MLILLQKIVAFIFIILELKKIETMTINPIVKEANY